MSCGQGICGTLQICVIVQMFARKNADFRVYATADCCCNRIISKFHFLSSVLNKLCIPSQIGRWSFQISHCDDFCCCQVLVECLKKMFSSSTIRKAFDAMTVNKQHFLHIVCMTSWFSSHEVVLLTYSTYKYVYFIYNLKVHLNTPPKKSRLQCVKLKSTIL